VKPRVTVLVPVYNRPGYVREALESALAQECPGGFEVLVVDDGSTDETPAVLASFGDRIRVIRQENAGPAVARNRAFDESRGEFVALLDSDDIWLPGKLAAQVALLDREPRAAVAHSEVAEFFEGDAERAWTRRPPIVGGRVLHALLARNTIHTMTVLLRKSVLDEVGGFDPSFPPCEDWDLWLRIAERHEFAGDPEPRVRTRIHEGGISSDPIVVYRQAVALLAAAGDRLAVSVPEEAAWARKNAARFAVKLGRRLHRKGDLDAARRAYDRAIELHPSARLQVLRARLFPKRG